LEYYKYFAKENMEEGISNATEIDESSVRQHDGQLSYLKS